MSWRTWRFDKFLKSSHFTKTGKGSRLGSQTADPATVVAGSESGRAGIGEVLKVRIRCEAGIPCTLPQLTTPNPRLKPKARIQLVWWADASRWKRRSPPSHLQKASPVLRKSVRITCASAKHKTRRMIDLTKTLCRTL
jgi:hypothetical protein